MASDDGLVEGSGDGQAPMGGQIRNAAIDAREMIAEMRATNQKVGTLIDMIKKGIQIHIVRVSDKKILDVIGEGGQIGDTFPYGGNIQFGELEPPETQE